jgi:hypothetical protein
MISASKSKPTKINATVSIFDRLLRTLPDILVSISLGKVSFLKSMINQRLFQFLIEMNKEES